MYAAILGGYIAGGIGTTKAVGKLQELHEKETEYTTPIEEIEKAKEFLEGVKPELSEETLEK